MTSIRRIAFAMAIALIAAAEGMSAGASERTPEFEARVTVHGDRVHMDQWNAANGKLGKLMDEGDYKAAMLASQDAWKAAQKLSGPKNPAPALTLGNVAEIYTRVGQYVQAEAMYKRDLGEWAKATGSESPQAALAMRGLAGVYGILGRWPEAEQLSLHALSIRRKAFGPNSISVAESLGDLGNLDSYQNHLDEARVKFQEALDIIGKLPAGDSRIEASTRSSLGEVELLQSHLWMPRRRCLNRRSPSPKGPGDPTIRLCTGFVGPGLVVRPASPSRKSRTGSATRVRHPA